MPAVFAPVVDAVRTQILATFPWTRLHSAYLYGSIPRGTAIPGVSDLDILLVLHTEPTDAERADATSVERACDQAHPQIDGVGILLASKHSLLSDSERHDGGFFVTCLCTPLLGHDLADFLPSYRPTSLLARETNGDLALLLPRWRTEVTQAATDHERKALNRRVARRIVRTGFTLIMPRWGGWTSDLHRSAELFSHYYPERAEQMRLAAVAGHESLNDPAILSMLIDDLGPWLAAEYTAVHSNKAARD